MLLFIPVVFFCFTGERKIWVIVDHVTARFCQSPHRLLHQRLPAPDWAERRLQPPVASHAGGFGPVGGGVQSG